MTVPLASRSRGRAHRYREAAQILNISERTVIREVRKGRLKADRLSERVVRIFDDSIDDYVAQHVRPGEYAPRKREVA